MNPNEIDTASLRLNTLFELLEQAHAGFDLSLHRRTTVGRWLLVRATKEGGVPKDWPQRLEPLLCANEFQQQRFREIVEQWQKKPIPTASVSEENVQESKQLVIKPPPRKPWLRILIATVLTIFVVWSWFAFMINRDTCLAVVPQAALCEWYFGEVSDTPVQPDPLPGQPLSEDSTLGWQPVERALEPIDLTVEDKVSIAIDSLFRWLFTLLPLPIVTAIITWLWAHRRAELRRGENENSGQGEYKKLIVASSTDPLPAANIALRALNQRIQIPGARGLFDTVASAISTAKQGLPSLKTQPLKRLPEVVLLLQRDSLADLRVELARLLLNQMRRQGLRASGYAFSGKGRRYYALDDGKGTVLQVPRYYSMGELQKRHPYAHVLLLTEVGRLYSVYEFALQNWAKHLARWRQPLPIFALNTPHKAILQRMKSDGLRLLPLGAVGFAALTELPSPIEHKQSQLPLHLMVGQWPSDPCESDARLGDMMHSQAFSEDFLALLGAVAPYPELHLGLAAEIDRRLFPHASNAARERRLVGLVRLPWSRHGWLPKALCESLYRRLPIDDDSVLLDRKGLVKLYMQLFQSNGGGHELSALQAPKSFWAWLIKRRQGGEQTMLLDMVLMPESLRKISQFSPTVERWLARMGAQHRAMATIALLGTALMSWAIWQPRWWQEEQLDRVALSVDLSVQPDSDKLGSELASWLEESGANVTQRSIPIEEQGITLTGAPSLDGAMRRIAEELRRMPSPQQINIVHAEANSSAELNTVKLSIGKDASSITIWRDIYRPIPTSYTEDILGGPITMIALLAGSFQMGSETSSYDDEKPVRTVDVPAFELAETELTFAHYDAFIQATNDDYTPNDRDWGRGSYPVINVSWDDANRYIEWLNTQTEGGWRLPSEAEWEYAARAGTTTPFFSGNCINTDVANYDGNVDYENCGAQTGVYRERTVSVDELNAANPWGFRHMAGNVWEWTADCWHDNYQNAPLNGQVWNGSENGDCSRRVLRGGSWVFEPDNLRSANRNRPNTVDRSNIDVGFRLARTLRPLPSAP